MNQRWMMVMMKNKMIASTGTENNLTVYGLNVFKGRKLFDIRKCYKNNDNEIVHTKKGISLNENSFSILSKLLTQESKTIQDWFQEKETDDSASSKLAAKASLLQESSYKKKKFNKGMTSSENGFFFEVKSNKEGLELNLNRKHNFFKQIESLDDKSVSIIYSLLMSFDQTINLYDEQKINSSDFIDDLKYTWSSILSNYSDE